MITATISSTLRKIGLLKAAERMRFSWERFKYGKVNRAFRKANPELALPPDFYIYETYKLHFREYYEDGKATALEIIGHIGRYKDLSSAGMRILDWGCGPGRITRHLPGILPLAEIHGTDFNPDYIDWCSHELNRIQFAQNKVDPPLNYPASFFDALIGFSIFTHLSEKNHPAWVHELWRVMKPGGIAYISTQGRASRVKLSAKEKKRFAGGLPVFRQYRQEGNRLYAAFQPASFMEKLFAGKFEVLEHIEAPLDQQPPEQDGWLLRKIG